MGLSCFGPSRQKKKEPDQDGRSANVRSAKLPKVQRRSKMPKTEAHQDISRLPESQPNQVGVLSQISNAETQAEICVVPKFQGNESEVIVDGFPLRIITGKSRYDGREVTKEYPLPPSGGTYEWAEAVWAHSDAEYTQLMKDVESREKWKDNLEFKITSTSYENMRCQWYENIQRGATVLPLEEMAMMHRTVWKSLIGKQEAEEAKKAAELAEAARWAEIIAAAELRESLRLQSLTEEERAAEVKQAADEKAAREESARAEAAEIRKSIALVRSGVYMVLPESTRDDPDLKDYWAARDIDSKARYDAYRERSADEVRGIGGGYLSSPTGKQLIEHEKVRFSLRQLEKKQKYGW